VELAEEAERARREGAAYKPRAQREAEARARRRAAESGGAGADEARGVRDAAPRRPRAHRAPRWPSLCSLTPRATCAGRAPPAPPAQLHPDKHRGTAADALEAVAAQFKDVMEAYDVLSDDERRASYDRLRAHALRGGGGGGGPGGGGPRTPEEAAAMLRGMREMARIRREGMRRSVKHAPLAAEVRCSLAKLHRGCTKGVAVLRRVVDATGALYEETKARKSAAPPRRRVSNPPPLSRTSRVRPLAPRTDLPRGHPQGHAAGRAGYFRGRGQRDGGAAARRRSHHRARGAKPRSGPQQRARG
jgi:curved DNA-binding protein CbpA